MPDEGKELEKDFNELYGHLDGAQKILKKHYGFIQTKGWKPYVFNFASFLAGVLITYGAMVL